jgi:nucleotide-binding universal stress UspA family protein
MKILAYTDGKENSLAALRFAAALSVRLSARLAVITTRSGTPATEEPPPLTESIALGEGVNLTPGIQVLVDAARTLASEGFALNQPAIEIHEARYGYLFFGQTVAGEPINFYECFGHFVEALNLQVAEHGYDLVVISPPRRRLLPKLMLGDPARKLALDLDTSLLVVRGGNIDSRVLICADGSAASRRIFPLLRHLIPALEGEMALIWVEKPDLDEKAAADARDLMAHAREWLNNCGKGGEILHKKGGSPRDVILEEAGEDAVIVMGASLRHDVYRRMMGSMTMQILTRTDASFLLIKQPPEADAEYLRDPFSC